MVKLRWDCDCKTCPGGESARGPNGEIVYGGWKCVCACHLKREEQYGDARTFICPKCNGTGRVSKSERKRKGRAKK